MQRLLFKLTFLLGVPIGIYAQEEAKKDRFVQGRIIDLSTQKAVSGVHIEKT